LRIGVSDLGQRTAGKIVPDAVADTTNFVCAARNPFTDAPLSFGRLRKKGRRGADMRSEVEPGTDDQRAASARSAPRASGRASALPGGEHTDRKRSVVALPTLAVIVAVCFILYLAQDLFVPLALGMLLAFILTPLVNALRRAGLSDRVAVIVTVVAAAGLVGSFVLVFAYQLSQIGANLPQYQGNVLSKIDSILEMGKDSRVIAHLQEMVADISARLQPQDTAAVTAGETAALRVELVETNGLMDWLTAVIIPALTPVAIFGLIAVIVVFALLERASLRDRLVLLIGGTNVPATSRLLAEAGSRVSSYLLAQLVVNVIYAVPIWLGLWLIGVPNALFFGIVTLILRFVPYIGTAISAILPLVMAFAVSPDWSLVLWTAALFGVVEFVTGNVIEPWFYGRRTGVSPMAVIVSAMFWTFLWGPMGLIIATPLTVCLVVIGQHVPSLRLFSIMLGDDPVPQDAARLYDRLLTGHPLTFDEVGLQAAKGRDIAQAIADYHGGRLMPVLTMAQSDLEAGLLSDPQAQRIAHAVYDLTERLDPVIEEEAARDDGAVPDPAEDEPPVLAGQGRRVAVIGVRSVLDDAAAELLAQAMRAEGAETMVLAPHDHTIIALRDFRPDAIVLTSLDGEPSPAASLRMRRFRRLLPNVRLVFSGVSEAPDGGQSAAQKLDEVLALVFNPASSDS
jgi:predicted PurR-regulated permease PerM